MVEATENTAEEADVIKIDTILDEEALKARVEEFSKKREALMIKYNDTKKTLYTSEFDFVWESKAVDGTILKNDYDSVSEYFKRLRAFYDKNVPFQKDEFVQCIRIYEYIDEKIAEMKKNKSYVPKISGEMVEVIYSYAMNGTITGLKEAKEKVYVLRPLNNTFVYFQRQADSLVEIEKEFQELIKEYEDIIEKAPPPPQEEN